MFALIFLAADWTCSRVFGGSEEIVCQQTNTFTQTTFDHTLFGAHRRCHGFLRKLFDFALPDGLAKNCRQRLEGVDKAPELLPSGYVPLWRKLIDQEINIEPWRMKVIMMFEMQILMKP